MKRLIVIIIILLNMSGLALSDLPECKLWTGDPLPAWEMVIVTFAPECKLIIHTNAGD